MNQNAVALAHSVLCKCLLPLPQLVNLSESHVEKQVWNEVGAGEAASPGADPAPCPL